METDEKNVEITDDLDINLEEETPQEQPAGSPDKAKLEGVVAGIVKRYLKDAQQKVPKQDLEDFQKVRDDINELKIEKAKRTFAYQNQLSPEETDMVFQFKQNPTKEDLDNPFVKGGIAALRAEKRVEEATPSPSGSASVLIEGKEFKDLTEEERKKNWEGYVDKSIKSKK